MRNLILLSLSCVSLWGQWAPPPPTSYPALDAWLSARIAYQTGSGSPVGIINCTAGKDAYTDTTSTPPVLYWCVATNTPVRIIDAMALAAWPGSINLTTLGTITTGTWHGTAIGDSYIGSAASWNSKQAAISGAPGTWPSFGGAALLSVGTMSGTVAAGNDARFVRRILWSNTFMDTPESDATSGYRAFGTGGATTYFSFDILADWPGALTLNLTGWSATATLSPTITVQHVCISSGSTATKSYAHSQSVTVVPAAASGRSVATPLALDLTGCAAGSEYFAALTIAGNTTAFNVLRVWVTE